MPGPAAPALSVSPGTPGSGRSYSALGVDEVVEPDDSEDAFLAALRGPTAEEADGARGAEPAEVPGALLAYDGAGSVLAVIGNKAPGASECAASLAALAGERWTCVLVDLDALGGGFDLRLGVDPRQGSLLGLARAVASGDGALGELLERWLAVCEVAARPRRPRPTRSRR